MNVGMLRRGAVVLALGSVGLGGCAFPGPQSDQDRQTLADCRKEADRVYDAQNRYQLSERDGRDTPFSGGSQGAQPSDGLADQYAHENRVADCVRHGDLTEENAPPATTAPAAAPASAVAGRP